MNILEKIVTDKRVEVTLKKKVVPETQLEKSYLLGRTPISLMGSLEKHKFGIIAEHKRRSPSKAVINQSCSVNEVVSGYDAGGAAGISILTDGKFFGGSPEDLLLARASTELPLLRKEFIIDPYQILESRALGADAILLIAAMMSERELKEFCDQAHGMGLEVLLEVHNLKELEQSMHAGADLIGVNNRNLKTFEVGLQTSRELIRHIPATVGKVSESGLGSSSELKELKNMGYQGFLMGESFMKEPDPGAALASLLTRLQG